jgi:putative tricarboxylic transport membrane protein
MRLGRIEQGNLVSGAVLAGLGVYIVLQARRWEYLGPDGPGPGFFPLWYGVAMIGLAAWLIVKSLARGETAPARPRAAPAPKTHVGEIGRALAAWAGLAVCVGLLKILGFLLAFALLTFFVTAVMYRRPILSALAVAVGSALAFYLLFPLALNVALPKGLFGF